MKNLLKKIKQLLCRHEYENFEAHGRGQFIPYEVCKWCGKEVY